MALQSVSTLQTASTPVPNDTEKAMKWLTDQEARHRRLDGEISTMEAQINPDTRKITESKRRRLKIRDNISRLRKQLGLPEIH